jgi:hypothetical protein
MLPTLLSGISSVPTPNVRSDVWDHVESYAIRMLLAPRLKITFTSNLKLIISFLVLHIVLLSLFTSLSLVASTRHAHLTLRINLRLADRPRAQFANSTIQGQFPSNEDQICPFSSQGRVFIVQVSRHGAYLAKGTLLFSATICSMQENKKIHTNILLTRTKFQLFLSKAPCSSVKKLIVSTPLLLQGLHTMSLAKSVLDRLKSRECK